MIQKSIYQQLRELNDPVFAASLISAGDQFEERLHNGPGVLSSGTVCEVDYEFGRVLVKYTSGSLEGVERTESSYGEQRASAQPYISQGIPREEVIVRFETRSASNEAVLEAFTM